MVLEKIREMRKKGLAISYNFPIIKPYQHPKTKGGLTNLLLNFTIPHNKVLDSNVIITHIYCQYIIQWITDVPPSCKELELNLQTPFVFDQNKGPNLK